MSLPTGTVTFYFSDIEGSTRLIQQLGSDYPAALLAHHEIQRKALAAHHGHELRTEGDSFFIVFESALDACAGAAQVQRTMAAHAWPRGSQLRVRIGLHTGEAVLIGNEYLGLEVHRAARIASSAHGGQVLLSETTRALVENGLASGMQVKDLGVHRLKDLSRGERLHQLCIDGVLSNFPPLRSLESTPNNLPTQMTSFIGRDDQVREAKQLLARSRLLTLTGPGGTGKTRLSLQVAADLLDQFPDGVFFIPLAAIHEPELVPSAIAQALSVQTAGNRRPIEALVDYLQDKQTLLVLDNFEQIIAAAPVATQLLEASPGLRVMVSSRAVLHVYGEQEFPVPPMALPHVKALPSLSGMSQFEAVRLFIERAVAVKPDFRATEENAAAIVEICQRVDGLPLAIELAAARVKLFSPQALLGRLEKSLTALGSGPRDLPGRQQTLRGAIQWSYELLDEAAQRMFERFSVFARGASLEQAELVLDSPSPSGEGQGGGLEILEALDQLADQSLLRRLPEFDEPRFLMLQTIREFASERLEQSGEAETIRRRHLEAFTALARKSQPHLFGPRGREWLDRLEIDHDNVRSAIEWAVASKDARGAMELAARFWRFWQMRGHLHEARRRLAAVLAMPGSEAFPAERLSALEAAGGVAYWQADMEAAEGIYDQCLELTRALGDQRAIANALYNAAFPRIVGKRDMPGALRLLAEALPIFRNVKDDTGVARTLWGLGNAYFFSADYAAALPYLEESEALYRKGDDRFGLAWSIHTLGLVVFRLGDVERARRAWLEATSLFVTAGDISGIILQLDNFSALALHNGDFMRAAKLWGASRNFQETSGTGLVSVSRGDEDRTGREGLTDEEVARAWADGQALSLDEAVAYALEGAAEAATTSG